MDGKNVGHDEATTALSETGANAPPFFVAAMAKSVTCEKCGCEVIPPGRLTMFDGMVSRTWCDCITEQEMNDLAVQFEALWRMWTGSPKVMQA